MSRRPQISDLWWNLTNGTRTVDGPKRMNYMPLSTIAMRMCAIIVLGGLAAVFFYSSGTTFLEAVQSVRNGEMPLALFVEHYWFLGFLLALAMPFGLLRIYLPVYMVVVVTLQVWGMPMSDVGAFVSHHTRMFTLLVLSCALNFLPMRPRSETKVP